MLVGRLSFSNLIKKGIRWETVSKIDLTRKSVIAITKLEFT